MTNNHYVVDYWDGYDMEWGRFWEMDTKFCFGDNLKAAIEFCDTMQAKDAQHHGFGSHYSVIDLHHRAEIHCGARH